MKLKNFDHLNCPVADTLGVIGEHWSMLIVRDAFMGSRRFEQFRKSLGIARNMLADRLRRLCEEGVLERMEGDGYPEYRLTEAGRDLAPVLIAMAQWGESWRPHDKGARITFVDRKNHKPIQPLKPRSERGRVLEYSELGISRDV